MKALQAKDIDLLVSYSQKPKKNHASGKVLRIAALPAALALLIGCVAAFFLLRGHSVQVKIDQVQAYLSDPQTVSDYAQAQQLSAEYQQIAAQLSQIAEIQRLVDTYPHLDRNLFSNIYAACGTTVSILTTSYNGKNGTLSITAQTPSGQEAPYFIDRLKATGLFLEVSYYGFAGENGQFGIQATCMMKEGNAS